VDEQRRIADFLDVETSRIDRLQALRDRQRTLISERWMSEVSSITTLGNGHTSTGTGNPWVPRIAKGWNLIPLKRAWNIVDCKHRTPRYVTQGYPVVSPGDVTPGRLDLTRAHRFVDEKEFADLADEPRRPRRGDVVYSRNASVGIASYVDTDAPFTMGQDVCRITSEGQDQLFLSYFLNSAGLAELQGMQIGSTFSRVNIATLLELSIPCPPVDKQRELARVMDGVTESTDRIVAALNRADALLAERRQALITAAVTGRIDVTTARPMVGV
jgi:type I restriction enzyme S subunit